jgi:hypothetical protein
MLMNFIVSYLSIPFLAISIPQSGFNLTGISNNRVTNDPLFSPLGGAVLYLKVAHFHDHMDRVKIFLAIYNSLK